MKYLSFEQSENPIAEIKDIRQKRIDKLDKKPLAIEDEPIDIPKFTAKELNAYKDKTKETRKE